MFRSSFLSALVGLLLSTLLIGADARVDPRIFVAKTAGEPASFLVVMREQADLSGAERFAGKEEKGRFVFEALMAQAEASQARLRADLEGRGVAYRSFFLVNMVEVVGNRALAEAPDVWSQGFTGQGVVIGMADTGVAWDHPALKSHYRGTAGTGVTHDYSWHDAIHNATAANPCGSNAPAPCDDDGHGTSTASLAVGDDGAGNQIGVAPGARFISCRNMDQGNGTPARYTECFQFMLAPTDSTGANPRPDLAAHVINNSWGCPTSEGCTDPNVLKTVVENVRAAGIAVVVSAGNGGPACSTISDPPAIYDASLSVGATSDSDAAASFSSRGPITADGSNRLKPDIAAPGVSLRVARPPST